MNATGTTSERCWGNSAGPAPPLPDPHPAHPRAPARPRPPRTRAGLFHRAGCGPEGKSGRGALRGQRHRPRPQPGGAARQSPAAPIRSGSAAAPPAAGSGGRRRTPVPRVAPPGAAPWYGRREGAGAAGRRAAQCRRLRGARAGRAGLGGGSCSAPRPSPSSPPPSGAFLLGECFYRLVPGRSPGPAGGIPAAGCRPLGRSALSRRPRVTAAFRSCFPSSLPLSPLFTALLVAFASCPLSPPTPPPDFPPFNGKGKKRGDAGTCGAGNFRARSRRWVKSCARCCPGAGLWLLGGPPRGAGGARTLVTLVPRGSRGGGGMSVERLERSRVTLCLVEEQRSDSLGESPWGELEAT